MNVGSMFSGIGGMDLGLERAGMTILWQAETDPYCCRVLARHWPEVPNLGDVTQIDWEAWARMGTVDLLCGGFPCPPVSQAGKRLGVEDERWLWPAMAEAVRCLRPRWVLVENVEGLLHVGGGTPFGQVIGALAQMGYDAEWGVLPASAFGAPHRRNRVITVAYPHVDGVERGPAPVAPGRGRQSGDPGGPADVAHTDRRRRQELRLAEPGRQQSETGSVAHRRRLDWRLDDAQGGAAHWAAEPDVGRVVDGASHRVDRLRALGNAMVPQVAEWIGRRILEVDRVRVAG